LLHDVHDFDSAQAFDAGSGTVWRFRGSASDPVRVRSIPALPKSDKRSRLSGSKSETDRRLELVSL
jgi:hypothetical protein